MIIPLKLLIFLYRLCFLQLQVFGQAVVCTCKIQDLYLTNYWIGKDKGFLDFEIVTFMSALLFSWFSYQILKLRNKKRNNLNNKHQLWHTFIPRQISSTSFFSISSSVIIFTFSTGSALIYDGSIYAGYIVKKTIENFASTSITLMHILLWKFA